MSFPDTPYPAPPAPPKRRSVPPHPVPRRVALALGAGALLAFLALGAALLRLATPTRARTITVVSTVYRSGTQVIWTPTPGAPLPTPTPNLVTVYVHGTPIIQTATPYPTPLPSTPYPTYTPFPSPTPVPATATPRPEILLHDPMVDFTRMYATSDDLNVNAIGPDSATINRSYWREDWAVWKTPNIVTFDLTAYYCTGLGDPANCDPNHPNLGIAPLAIEESADDVTWCTPGYSQTTHAPDPNHPDWTPVEWRLAANCVTGATYLRVTWQNTDSTFPVWSPALGDLSIQYQP